MTTSLGAVFPCRRLSNSTVRSFDRVARGTSRLGSCGSAAEHGGMHCLHRRLANREYRGAGRKRLCTAGLGSARWATCRPRSRSRPAVEACPPVLTQRICEYIESHLDRKIGLEALAAIAGLSVHHFAREFNQSVGIPPHSYLLSRRLERAERMLRETQLPLSEIAVATGFSDQSHLAWHFRRRTGMSPRLARWKER
jgi:AraC-like DNA-binding protein